MRIIRGLFLVFTVAVLGCGGDDSNGEDDAGATGGSGGSGADAGITDSSAADTGSGGDAARDGGASPDAGNDAGSDPDTGMDSGGDPDAAHPDTGSPAEQLVACDITAEPDPCLAPAVCSGRPWAGFYCRAVCPEDSQPGDTCGNSGVCLEASPGDEETIVCFELDECDYQTADGCDIAAGESCVLIQFEPLRRACVPSGDLGVGERCDAKAKNMCIPGTACLGSDIEDGNDGRCSLLCHPGETVPDGCVECIEFSPDLGSCAECSVLDNDCDTGETCYPTSEALGGTCVPIGPGGADDPCSYDPSSS